MKNCNAYILFIHFSPSNILFSLTKLNGEVLKFFSVGSYKTAGVKKISLTSIKTVVSNVTQFIRNMSIHVKCRGSSRFKRLLVKSICKTPRVKILSLCDITAFPHNGVRKSKARRV